MQELCAGTGAPLILLNFLIRLHGHARVLWMRRVTVLPWHNTTSGIGQAKVCMNVLDNDTELMSPPLSAPEIVCHNNGAAAMSF